MTTLIGKVVRWLSYSLAIVIILAATAVSMSQLLRPYLNEHRTDLAKWASDLLNIPITINQVDISWRRFKPALVLQKVAVLNYQTHKPTVEIQQITVTLQVIQSLLQKKLLPDDIKIEGVRLTVHEQKPGQLHVEGLNKFVFTDPFTGGSVAGSAMGAWIFSQPHLVLRHIEIEFIPKEGLHRSVTLTSLELQNTKMQHVLSGQATLNQAMPTQVAIQLQWDGDTFNIMQSTARVHLYLYLESIALPQWISQQTWQNLQIKQGVGSGKFWVTWDHGQLQKVRSQFQLYEMQLQSLITKKIVVIPRINGRLGWQRDGAHQIISGDNILIDFPNHLWPTTQFSLSFLPADAVPQPPLRRKMSGYTLQMSYLDLDDTKELALASGLLSQPLQKLLLNLNPMGEVRSLNIQSDESATAENTLYSAEFSNLTLNPWQLFPGVMNSSGQIFWDGTQGKLTLNSQKTTVIFNTLFATPLQFDTLSGGIQWKKDATGQGWSIDVKNFQASNADIALHTNMTLLLPYNASPSLNLSGTFSVPHVAQIENYLPIKKFEPPFIKWLHNRFQSGRIASGDMMVQGKFDDFPFEKGGGKFLIHAALEDVEFNYAPGWPSVHHAEGELIFSGHSMTAEMKSAELLGVPLANVHGDIPYIGPAHPQVLNLKAMINADLEQGLRFIQESPLRNTIGKDLEEIQLNGAMKLSLAFIIPVKTPEKTQVQGDVSVSSALLQLPSWNLTLNALAGSLHFTEQAIQIPQMQGRLFDEPVHLTMNTVRAPNAPPVVTAVLQSQISQPVLEKWLAMPLARFVTGSAPYTAELRIVSHQYPQPSQLLIHSDLAGFAINLPEIYAKAAGEVRDFQLMASLKQDQPLQMKITYGKLLTAALTYEKSAKNWQLKSGELRLGDQGQANWQTQPGLFVTGKMDQVDWTKWHTYFSSLVPHQNNQATESDAFSHYLRGTDINVNQLAVAGQRLMHARVQISQEEKNWKVGVTSTEMTGQVWLPMGDSQAVTRARFQHIYLMQSKEQQSLDPKTIPALSFVGDDVRYQNKYLGHIALDIAPDKAGLRIQKLNVFTDFFNLDAKGVWSLQRAAHKTVLQGTLTTKNVGQLLDHWELGSASLIAGAGHATFDFNWLDAPYHPSLASMSGEITLQLGKGRVINLGDSTDAKMGFGRMLNLLSLQTLPRRLSLDFTDLFEKGYSFDIMQGHFTIEPGSARTKDTYFDGPIARIEIKGKIGITAKDYDLILSVTPYVTGSIPIVATLAGGPVVGAVTWLVEKVASNVVSKVATYHYSVRGPWSHPIWVQTGGLSVGSSHN